MSQSIYLLGLDIGSSSVKASVINAETGKSIGSAMSPEKEMEMISVESGWAEQHPQMWWEHTVKAVHKAIAENSIRAENIKALGISYQMHGLVAVDKNREVLRPSIIWCDSRAAEIGNKAFHDLGEEYCLKHFLNSPGNFTASKLKWVQENEPEIYQKIDKIMLPGDYIAMKLTGRICTTVSGLSEGILWDHLNDELAAKLLDYYGISEDLIPEPLASFDVHGELTSPAAEELGLQPATKVSYRAGDQPNNALSLNVLNPGEVAATAGTSGVVYGITDQPDYDPKSRVNSFAHVNHSASTPRFGVLLCVNGTGILNSWLKKTLSNNDEISYDRMNQLAAKAPVGADGLTIFPFGNGAERILENKNTGAQLRGLDFNRHDTTHLLRAGQEGIVFALNYGFDIMKDMGMNMETVRAGHSNMFLSPLFREAFVNVTGTTLELYNTDGSQGAARGAGLGAGIYQDYDEAFQGLEVKEVTEPEPDKAAAYTDAYSKWLARMPHE
jgi:xylulokinase